MYDDGTGFDGEFLPRAFERFTRADEARARGGTGLGFAIVDVIARAHGGSTGAANRLPHGADVSMAFPRTATSDRRRFNGQPIPRRNGIVDGLLVWAIFAYVAWRSWGCRLQRAPRCPADDRTCPSAGIRSAGHSIARLQCTPALASSRAARLGR